MNLAVVGIGMSSQATAAEVRELVTAVAARVGFTLRDLDQLATRERFVSDPRLDLGPRVVGVNDAELLRAFPNPSPPTPTGLAARVADGCALIAAGSDAELRVPTVRSAHATAALAVGTRSDPVDVDGDSQ